MNNRIIAGNKCTEGVQGAKLPANMDYNQGADWWLRRNAKTFGYTYSARATKR